jgi:hypothetical protein
LKPNTPCEAFPLYQPGINDIAPINTAMSDKQKKQAGLWKFEVPALRNRSQIPDSESVAGTGNVLIIRLKYPGLLPYL